MNLVPYEIKIIIRSYIFHNLIVVVDMAYDDVPTRYMAPEIFLEGKFSAYSDIWAVCILADEILNYAAFPFSEVKDLSLQDIMHSVSFYYGHQYCHHNSQLFLYRIAFLCWIFEFIIKREYFRKIITKFALSCCGAIEKF